MLKICNTAGNYSATKKASPKRRGGAEKLKMLDLPDCGIQPYK
jgi:hypothetical protein